MERWSMHNTFVALHFRFGEGDNSRSWSITLITDNKNKILSVNRNGGRLNETVRQPTLQWTRDSATVFDLAVYQSRERERIVGKHNSTYECLENTATQFIALQPVLDAQMKGSLHGDVRPRNKRTRIQLKLGETIEDDKDKAPEWRLRSPQFS